MSTPPVQVIQNYDKSFRPIFDGTKDPYVAEDKSSLPLNMRNRSRSAPPRLQSRRRNRGRTSRRGRGRTSRRGRGRTSRRGRGRGQR
jgi:hypothetical protein